ncbi:MAG: A/G-specific adenine glycosylase [Bacteroidetes bacterium]|nr:A/G-specific adenine glycosylase [Bacteroidota bacterium]
MLDWNQHLNQRKMPWKGIRDPYKIWLSEIILQQTRVIQGEKYYLAFTKKYPNIHNLALAKEEEVFRLWQGLGYYNRCRNLLLTAKIIAEKYHGQFPNTYHEIRELKGIGDYTAAAIASFAYNLPHAVVDGNVVRVLSRIFGIKKTFHDAKGKKYFQELAFKLMPSTKSAQYNQAIMDFGAIICKPASPHCTECPFSKICIAKAQNKVTEYPVKKEKKALKIRHFHFYVLQDETNLYLIKRNEKDIWKDLHTPYMIETNGKEKPNSPIFLNSMKVEKSFSLRQQLTHQQLYGHFRIVHIESKKQHLPIEFIKVKKTALTDFAFPRMIISFFKKFDYL